jgi:holo-[acyl-carrier protein] synthase
MIVGVGIDIVLIERISAMLERYSGRAKEKLYTATEREYCDGMPEPVLHYAARFAAKEAFVKALGTGFAEGIRWKDIGIRHDGRGKPELEVEGRALEWMQSLEATHSHVSLTHDAMHAGAVVILEKG